MSRLMAGLRESEKRTKEKRGRMKQETPFEELRHAFVVGRPVEVFHTPLSAVSAAEAELTRLELAIGGKKLECMAQVALVVEAKNKGVVLFVANHLSEQAAKTITAIAALTEPKIAGLVYCIVNPKTGEYEFWTKAFFRGRDTEKILDLAVSDGVNKLRTKAGVGAYSA